MNTISEKCYRQFGDKVKELSQTPSSPDLDYFASLAEND